MQTAKLKKQTKIINPYSLRRRFYSKDGKPKEWQELGTGQFIDIETVQRQISMLNSNYPNSLIEIEFIYEGQLRNMKGEVTGKTMMFSRR